MKHGSGRRLYFGIAQCFQAHVFSGVRKGWLAGTAHNFPFGAWKVLSRSSTVADRCLRCCMVHVTAKELWFVEHPMKVQLSSLTYDKTFFAKQIWPGYAASAHAVGHAKLGIAMGSWSNQEFKAVQDIQAVQAIQAVQTSQPEHKGATTCCPSFPAAFQPVGFEKFKITAIAATIFIQPVPAVQATSRPPSGNWIYRSLGAGELGGNCGVGGWVRHSPSGKTFCLPCQEALRPLQVSRISFVNRCVFLKTFFFKHC